MGHLASARRRYHSGVRDMGASAQRDFWRARVLLWREMYPDLRWVRGKYDPSKVKATPLRCRKCGSTQQVTRHHKGHEYLFACIMPEWYAGRYIRFARSDWVPLCNDRCHPHIHELYAPIVDEVKQYVEGCLKEIIYGDPAPGTLVAVPVYIWLHKPDRRVLESFRKRLIAKCDWWLARKNKKTRRGKYKSYR